MSKEDASQHWQRQTIAYARAINAYIEKGLREGWDNVGDEPSSAGREKLVPALLEALREANRSGRLDGLQATWPPAHAPLNEVLDEKGQAIPCWRCSMMAPSSRASAPPGSRGGWCASSVIGSRMYRAGLLRGLPQPPFYAGAGNGCGSA